MQWITIFTSDVMINRDLLQCFSLKKYLNTYKYSNCTMIWEGRGGELGATLTLLIFEHIFINTKFYMHVLCNKVSITINNYITLLKISKSWLIVEFLSKNPHETFVIGWSKHLRKKKTSAV